jgi:hypothetical protein
VKKCSLFFFLISKLINNLKSEKYIEEIRSKISDEKTFSSPFYGTGMLDEDHGTCKIFILYFLMLMITNSGEILID